MFGFLNINKPKGITSHDVIAKLRKVIKIKQIGHSGTLDPLAQGVLPVAVGKATRLLEYLSDEKAYIVTLEFGKISDTYDTEGNIEFFSDNKVTADCVLKCLPNFSGNIVQIPPAFSAVHYNGKRLYELAREGIFPEDIPKREVFVESIKMLDFNDVNQTCIIEIYCSKGTYIRSIVHDLGQMLNVGAVMTDLVRIKSSNFVLDTATELAKLNTAQDVQAILINPLEVLSYNRVNLSEEEYSKVKNGNPLPNPNYPGDSRLMLEFQERLVAFAKVQEDIIKLDKVFV